jgi:hypothetical protein
VNTLIKMAIILSLSVLNFGTFAKNDQFSCLQCDKRTRNPITDDSENGVSSIYKYMNSPRKPASQINCDPIVDETSREYFAGPSQLYSKDCRKLHRRHSLNVRGLSENSNEEYYWLLKDDLQRYRDIIRRKAVEVAIHLLAGNPDYIDVTKHPEIASLTKTYKQKLGVVESERKKLEKYYRGNRLKHDAYVEQGLIIRVKDESFKMNMADIRSSAISQYLVKYDPKIKKMYETIQYTKDPELLRGAIDKFLDGAINDPRDPRKHYDHYLNNNAVDDEIYVLLLKEKGKNQEKTRLLLKGESRKDRVKDVIRLKYKARVKTKERMAKYLRTSNSIAHIYADKNLNLYNKGAVFQDYDGEDLYFQSIAHRHESLEGIKTLMPEEIENKEKRLSLEGIFDLSKLSKTERRILSKSKSLSSHKELKGDISKIYNLHKSNRQYYE